MGDLSSKALSLPQPNFGAARALRMNLPGGNVRVDVIVDENGNVVSATATHPHSFVRGYSVAAAKKAKFPRSSNKMKGYLIYTVPYF